MYTVTLMGGGNSCLDFGDLYLNFKVIEHFEMSKILFLCKIA